MPLAYIGELGQTILFLFTLVGVTIVLCYTLGYAGVSLLSVVQETAAGNEELTWPDDALADKVGQALYFGALLALVLGPVGMLARALHEDLFPNDNGLRFLVLAVPGLWLLFPIGLLSSLTGSSRWFLVHPVLVARLLRQPSATMTCYAVSALLAALTATAWFFVLFSAYGLYVLPLAAGLSAWLWLLYARLLGRLACLVGQFGPVAGTAHETPTSLVSPRKRKRPRVESHDPWATPPEDEQPARPVIAEGEVVEPYALGSYEKPVYPDADLLAGRIPETREDKAERRARKRRRAQVARPAPAGEGLQALFRGLTTFPIDGRNAGVLFRLTFGFLAAGGGLLALRLLYPA